MAMVNKMVVLPDGSAPEIPCVPAESGKAGLLLSQDLIFTTKIKGTAAELGYSMMVASSETQAQSMIEAHRPRVVLIDLNAGALVGPDALIAYQSIAGSNAWFVAFGSHVEVGALNAARAAGCHVVLPRSRFAAELPQLMGRFFSQPPRHDR
jgi:DNA-binding NarL/FixJ family response regulator